MYGYNDNDYGRIVIKDIILKELVSAGDAYCYYDSSSSNVVTLFEKISNKIEGSVSSIGADKLKITFSINQIDDLTFHLEDKNGVRVEGPIVVEEDIVNITNKLSLEGYRIVLDDAACPFDETCEYSIKLFNIKLEFINSNNSNLTKEVILSDDDLPTINIKYQS